MNNAPVVSGSAQLGSTAEDAASPGILVSALLAQAGYSDPDGVAPRGIAITAASGGGTWQYSTDNVTWTSVLGVSDFNALLLDANSYVRFLPAPDVTGNASLTVRGWDQTTGTASTNGVPHIANTTANGGSSAFSSGTF